MSMRGYLAESSPDFKQAQTELAAMRSQMTRIEKEEPATIGGNSDGDYIAKFRDFKYHETLFELFAKQYEIARVDENRESSIIQVVDIAQIPERKSKPKKAMLVLTTTFAVGFALLLFVFIRQALSDSTKRSKSSKKLDRLRNSLRVAVGRKSL
jgi:capsule polysaccharide export protein KpsE/RkpR